MTHDGASLKAFVESGNLRPVRIYREMGISKQSFYSLYKSKEFEKSTIENLERVLSISWSDIKKVNIDDNISRETARNVFIGHSSTDPEFLKNTIDRMLTDREKALAVIEDLTGILKQQYVNWGQAKPIQLSPPGTEGTETKNPRKTKKPVD